MPVENLRMSVPEDFHLPFCPSENTTVIIENKNSSWIDFNIETNNPQTMKIKPEKGCIKVGKEVHILVSRPRFLPSYFTKEYLIFKIKYCYHDILGNPNAKCPTQYQCSKMQEYIIYNKKRNADIRKKQTYCECNACKNSSVRNQLYDRLRILSSQDSANSLSTDETMPSKNRHPYKLHQPFFATVDNVKQSSSIGSFRHFSPLKHTEGAEKNIAKINKFIEQAKVRTMLLKRYNAYNVSSDNSTVFNHCHASNKETIPKTVDDQKLEEMIVGCNCDSQSQDNDLCICCECSDCPPLIEDYSQNYAEFFNFESNQVSCSREVNECLENTRKKKGPKGRKRKIRPITRGVETEMAKKSISKYRWLLIPIFIILSGIIAFYLCH